MKFYVAAAIALAASQVGAEETELLFIGNAAENDSQYYQASYRQALTGVLDEGVRLRLDLARGDYKVTGTDARVDTSRVLLGYSFFAAEDTSITLTAGASHRVSSIETELPYFTEKDEWGFFGAAELNASYAGGGEFFALAEYDGAFETSYFSMHYTNPFAGVEVGPTVNYLHEGDYSRWAAGVRGNVELSDTTELSLSAAYSEADIESGSKQDTSYVELQLRTAF